MKGSSWLTFSFRNSDLFRHVNLGASMVHKPLMQARNEFKCLPHIGRTMGLADAACEKMIRRGCPRRN
jgi:hypothetical protein